MRHGDGQLTLLFCNGVQRTLGTLIGGTTNGSTLQLRLPELLCLGQGTLRQRTNILDAVLHHLVLVGCELCGIGLLAGSTCCFQANGLQIRLRIDNLCSKRLCPFARSAIDLNKLTGIGDGIADACLTLLAEVATEDTFHTTVLLLSDFTHSSSVSTHHLLRHLSCIVDLLQLVVHLAQGLIRHLVCVGDILTDVVVAATDGFKDMLKHGDAVLGLCITLVCLRQYRQQFFLLLQFLRNGIA